MTQEEIKDIALCGETSITEILLKRIYQASKFTDNANDKDVLSGKITDKIRLSGKPTVTFTKKHCHISLF